MQYLISNPELGLLTKAPDVSNNSELLYFEYIDNPLIDAPVTQAPDVLHNIMLQRLDLPSGYRLTQAPDVSSNTHLISLSLSLSRNHLAEAPVTQAPDISSNTTLQDLRIL